MPRALHPGRLGFAVLKAFKLGHIRNLPITSQLIRMLAPPERSVVYCRRRSACFLRFYPWRFYPPARSPSGYDTLRVTMLPVSSGIMIVMRPRTHPCLPSQQVRKGNGRNETRAMQVASSFSAPITTSCASSPRSQSRKQRHRPLSPSPTLPAPASVRTILAASDQEWKVG